MKFIKHVMLIIVVLLIINFDAFECRKNSKKSKGKIMRKITNKNIPKNKRIFHYLLGGAKNSVKDECLLNEDDILNMYPDLQGQDITVNNIMNRLRFIHGNCNPVIVVPGLLATRLEAVINCGEINKDKSLKKEITFHCGSKICSTENVESHTFWPDANTSAFKMKIDKTNPYNECYGYFMRFYNTQKSCLNQKDASKTVNHCMYSDYVRLVPHGLETNKGGSGTFNCGFNSVNQILNVSLYGAGGLIKHMASATHGFLGILNKLKTMGYREGFSLAAIPYEFKEAFCQNEYFKEAFKSHVERLFTLTGKKVIIVAHSYGNLNSHYQFLADPEFYTNRIAHFISIAAPFAGTGKGEFLIERGSNEFIESTLGLDYSRFSQSQHMITTLSGLMLRRFNFFDSIKDIDSDLKEAFSKYAEYSTCMGYKSNTECDEMLKKPLLKLFKSELEWSKKSDFCLTDVEQKTKYLEWLKVTKTDANNDYVNLPDYNACNFNIFDYKNCAAIKIRSIDFPSFISRKELLKELCKPLEENQDKSETFYYTDCKNTSKQCTDEYLKKYSQNPLTYPEKVLTMCQRLNPNIVMDQCKKELPSFFKFYSRENIAKIAEDLPSICSDEKKILSHPQIRTTIIFNRSILTRSAMLTERDIGIPQDRTGNLFVGGDGTVEADSTLFVGLKWIYEAKKFGFPKINLLDYCSPIKQADNWKYEGVESLKEKNYQFLDCQCDYTNKNSKLEPCTHAEMLNDNNIISVVADIASDGGVKYKEANQKLFQINQTDIKIYSSTNKACFDIYHEMYYRNFVGAKNKISKRLNRKSKGKKHNSNYHLNSK